VVKTNSFNTFNFISNQLCMRSSVFTFHILLILCLVSYQSTAQSPGLFLNDHTPKTISNPAFTDATKPNKGTTVSVGVDFTDVITPVSKYLFGNNANPYMTQVVDQPVLIDYIKTLSPNLIRFPGGNISSIYFWNATTQGDLPLDVPQNVMDGGGVQGGNWPYWYGGNNAGWTMSVDSYYQMLEMTSSTGIITVNYGYARYSKDLDPVAQAAHLAADWVRYDNGRTKFWEVGNESNGTWQAGYQIKLSDNQDGQPQNMTGALYGEHFKVFADSMRKAATEVGATIYIGAQLLQEAPASWWNDTDKNWNTGVFQKAGNVPDFYIIHSYFTPYAQNTNAADILNSATTVTEDMMEYVTASMTNGGVTQKPIALTEWNIFAEGSKQAVSFINGMHSAIVVGEMIKHKYGQASKWDLANGWNNGNDHGMFSQGDEPDNNTKWNPRPQYHYMYYFQKYFGDHMVDASVTGSTDVLVYASKFESGQSGIVVVNKGTAEQTVGINMQHFGYGDHYYVYTLTGGTDNGDFSRKVFVNGSGPVLASGGPDVKAVKARRMPIGAGVTITAPKRSVSYILIENGDNVITGMEDEVALKVNVHPNPSSGSFTIDFPAQTFRNLELVDLQGRTLISKSIEPHQTSVTLTAPLQQNLFVVKLAGLRRTVSRKVVIR
jgi:alpha-L-arabinofuranosidase